MNQAILFSDNEQYQAQQQQVRFQAQYQGALITCCIDVAHLYQLNEQTPPPESSEATVMALFENARFDIEDLAETMIQQQSFDQDGHIHLSFS